MSQPSRQNTGPVPGTVSSTDRLQSGRQGPERAPSSRPLLLHPPRVAEPPALSTLDRWRQAWGFVVIGAVILWMALDNALGLGQEVFVHPLLELSLLAFLTLTALLTVAQSYRIRYRADLAYTARLFLLNRQLQDLATLDGITALHNHRYFQEKLRYELDRAARYERPLSLVMADLNKFKQVNDLYGHPAGDLVLASVARAISSSLRSSDIAARYGGDEFALILPEAPFEAAEAVAGKISEAVAQARVHVNNGDAPISVTLCAGVATFPENGRSADELIEHADRELYRLKKETRSGRAA